MLEPENFGEFLVVTLEELEGSESLADRDTMRSASKPDPEQGGRHFRTYLMIRAILKGGGELACSQIMFFTGSDGVRLACFEDSISRMGVGLDRG